MPTIIKRFFCQLFLLILCINANAQIDTVLSIPEVEIVEETIRSQTLGSVTRVWSRTELREVPSLALPELLQRDGVYVKSYGLGSLATTSIRGGSAGHTVVLWNGLPIASPTLGQLDLSLLPIGSFSSVELQRGGSSSAWGSGAIGGVIGLNSVTTFNKGLGISYESVLGDFGRIRQNLSFDYSDQKFYSKSTFEYREARNDFIYSIGEDFERKQPNAKLFQRLFTQDFGWKLNEKSVLTANLWHQSSYREIPPTNVQFRSEAYQEDEATRVRIGYDYSSSSWKIKVSTAYFDESIFFVDPIILLESPSTFNTWLLDGTAEYRLNSMHSFLLGQTFISTEATTENYDTAQLENRYAIFGIWRIQKERLKLQASLRQEIVDSEFIVPIPSFGVEFALSNNLLAKAKVSRNYRLPTLNDRYWNPGGNPDLKAESGWSQEVSVDYQKRTGDFSFKASQTFYNRNIDNWIMWNPGEGGFWSASNVATVWSRGTESRFNVGWSKSKWIVSFEAGYDRILSTNEGNLDVSGMDVGEQLLYTPEQLAFAGVTIAWSSLSISYRHNYTDESRGVNEEIPEFNTADLRIKVKGTSVSNSSIQSSFFLDIMNLYKAEYVVIDRRPMPDINLQAGIRINFQSSNHKP
ncbi:MAG: TonB-dependent receptor [Bacteroidota bacterium]